MLLLSRLYTNANAVFCPYQWPKSGGSKIFLLASLAEFVPHFQNRGAAPAYTFDMCTNSLLLVISKDEN